VPAGWGECLTHDTVDALFAAAPLSRSLLRAGLSVSAEPAVSEAIVSAPVQAAGGMPSQAPPPAKAPPGKSKARTVKLRNAIGVSVSTKPTVTQGWLHRGARTRVAVAALRCPWRRYGGGIPDPVATGAGCAVDCRVVVAPQAFSASIAR
jgi:hypothetical protein